MTIDEALRVIIAASPAGAGEAMVCIQAMRSKSPIIGVRFNRAVELAFSDPEAQFTTEQRAAIAQMVDIPNAEDNRSITFRMRLTEAERDAIQAQASADGLTMSEWAAAIIRCNTGF